MTLEADERDLVARAKAGDWDAFEALVGRHERRLYGLAYGILQSREDAQDAVQKAFLAAVEHLKDFREQAAFGTWIGRIATNQALELLRSRKVRRAEVYDESEGPDDTEAVRLPRYIAAWKETPEDLAGRAQTRALIAAALAELDEKHRTVFVLRDMEGRSVAETAAALGITEGNVKVRLLRARLALRERLTAAFGDPATRVEPHLHGSRNLSAPGPSRQTGDTGS